MISSEAILSRRQGRSPRARANTLWIDQGSKTKRAAPYGAALFFCGSSRPEEDALSGKTYLLSGAGAGFGASGAGAAGLASGAGTGAGATGVAAGLGASAAGAGFASGAFGASAFFSAAGASAFFSAGAGAPPSQAANERATAEAARTEVICTFMVGDSGFGVEMCL